MTLSYYAGMFKKMAGFIQARWIGQWAVLALGLCSLVTAQSNTVAFFVDGISVTQDEVELNRLALSLNSSDTFSIFSFLGQGKVTAEKCPITFEERRLEQFGYDMQTAAIFQATANRRPAKGETEGLVFSDAKALKQLFIKYFQPAGRSEEEFREGVRKIEGLYRIMQDITSQVKPSSDEIQFYRQITGDQDKTGNGLKKHKFATTLQRWVDDTRERRVFSFSGVSTTPWNPNVASVDGVEISLEQFLRNVYVLNGFGFFNIDPLDPTDGFREEMTFILCGLEQQLFKNPLPSGEMGISIKTPMIYELGKSGVPMNFTGFQLALLERLVDQVIAEKFVQRAKLPFVTVGSKLLSELKLFQARAVTVTDAEVRAYFVEHRDDYITEESGVLTGAWFQTEKQASDFRSQFLKFSDQDWQALTRKFGGSVKNYSRLVRENLPEFCFFCLIPERLTKTGNGFVTKVIEDENLHGVVLLSEFVPDHPSSLEEARAEVTADTLRSAKEKYGRAWLATERKNHVIVNNFPAVVKELEARVQNKPR
jgi:hypothetical protein